MMMTTSERDFFHFVHKSLLAREIYAGGTFSSTSNLFILLIGEKISAAALWDRSALSNEH